MGTSEEEKIEKIMEVIRVWIKTESGPTRAVFSVPDLKVKITIKGYKKIILERTFNSKV
jgi:hypothetical protein